jgi:peptidoglycan/xylan/chitin deacetylase (PgdA/CDA1 family)
VLAVAALVGLVSYAATRAATMQVTTSRAVAFTFDDLPATRGSLAAMQEVTNRLLGTLVEEHVPATGFVNEVNLFVPNQTDARTALLEAWLDAGLDLGNHTYSHVAIDRVPFETYRADLIRGETVTRRLLEARGRKLRYFRHTQLRTGPTPDYKAALDALLAERNYRVAPVTVDNNDFVFAAVYARAKSDGDSNMVARVVEAYVPYMESVFAHFERVSRDFMGYEVRQILLLHANELNADYLTRLIRMLRARGYRFITLDAALDDPAYALPDVQSVRGLSWLHRWMLAKGLPMRPEPLEPSFIRESFNR